jgi:hypothetical protein
MSLSKRKLRFDLKNKGNAHFRAQKITLVAKAGTKVLHKMEQDGWYVLAGGTHTYTLELPEAACKGLTAVELQVKTNVGSTKSALANASCGG